MGDMREHSAFKGPAYITEELENRMEEWQKVRLE